MVSTLSDIINLVLVPVEYVLCDMNVKNEQENQDSQNWDSVNEVTQVSSENMACSQNNSPDKKPNTKQEQTNRREMRKRKSYVGKNTQGKY